LYREKAMTPGATVTFFLDEFDRLGPMDMIERAIDAPEQGVRLWMYVADNAAMTDVYPNAPGMIASCAAQCYIEANEATARELSLRIGTAKNLFGADERLILDPATLMGPDFADKVIALVRGQSPAKLLLPGETLAPSRRTR